MSTTQHDRLATESTQERAPRLQQMGITQCERLSAESAKEDEARLIYVSAKQLEGRAAESSLWGFSSRHYWLVLTEKSHSSSALSGWRWGNFHKYRSSLYSYQKWLGQTGNSSWQSSKVSLPAPHCALTWCHSHEWSCLYKKPVYGETHIDHWVLPIYIVAVHTLVLSLFCGEREAIVSGM